MAPTPGFIFNNLKMFSLKNLVFITKYYSIVSHHVLYLKLIVTLKMKQIQMSEH